MLLYQDVEPGQLTQEIQWCLAELVPEDTSQSPTEMETFRTLVEQVAHDLKNILTVINGYTELMFDDFAPQVPIGPYLELMTENIGQATLLIQQLLTVDREQVRQAEVLDLNAVVTDLEETLRCLMGEDVELVIGFGPRLPLIKANRRQLEQVILNLAINARDAMPDGGQLIIETAQVLLPDEDIPHRPQGYPGSYVRLAMTDTGVGIGAATQASIFAPYFTTKVASHGTGLGLAQVRRVVTQQGGYIDVFSQVGQGTTFMLYLKVKE